MGHFLAHKVSWSLRHCAVSLRLHPFIIHAWYLNPAFTIISWDLCSWSMQKWASAHRVDPPSACLKPCGLMAPWIFNAACIKGAFSWHFIGFLKAFYWNAGEFLCVFCLSWGQMCSKWCFNRASHVVSLLKCWLNVVWRCLTGVDNLCWMHV